MQQLLDIVVLGSTLGSLGALLATSFAMIYNMTHTFHVAHAGVMAISGYAAYFVLEQLHGPVWCGIVAAVIAGVISGCAIEILLYQRLRRAGTGEFTIFMASVGVLSVVEGALAIIWGPGDVLFSSLPYKSVDLFTVAVGPANIAMYGSWILILATIGYVLGTRRGRFLRATGDSIQAAELLGIQPARSYLVAFAIGSGLVALDGFVTGWYEGLSPSIGLSVVLVGVAATIIGGPYGLLPAAIVGFLVGLLQAGVDILISPTWENTIVFGFLLVFILARPKGIFGTILRV